MWKWEKGKSDLIQRELCPTIEGRSWFLLKCQFVIPSEVVAATESRDLLFCRPRGTRINSPSHPALRLRLRAGLNYFAPDGAGFSASKALANTQAHSYRFLKPRLIANDVDTVCWSAPPKLHYPIAAHSPPKLNLIPARKFARSAGYPNTSL